MQTHRPKLARGMSIASVYLIAAHTKLNWRTAYRAYSEPNHRLTAASRELISRAAKELNLPPPLEPQEQTPSEPPPAA